LCSPKWNGSTKSRNFPGHSKPPPRGGKGGEKWAKRAKPRKLAYKIPREKRRAEKKKGGVVWVGCVGIPRVGPFEKKTFGGGKEGLK